MIMRVILLSILMLFGTVTIAPADVYVPNGDAPSVTVYDTNAIGDTPPIRTIAGPRTGFNYPYSVTTDLDHGELYVVDFFGEAIRVFNLMANGDVAPLRTLVNGPNSHLGQPRMVALDLLRDQIYVVSFNNAIRVFPRTAAGDVAPVRTIEGPQTRIVNSIGMVLDLVHNEIIVDSYEAGGENVPGILVFARAAAGDVPPLRAIAGSLTRFGTFTNNLDLDAGRDEIYAQGNDGHGIVVFPRTASGNVAPVRNLVGFSTGIVWVSGIVVDEPNRRLILTDGTLSKIPVFDRLATGDAPPLMYVGGPHTGLATPWNPALDATGGFTGRPTDVADPGASAKPGLSLGANPRIGAAPAVIEFSTARTGHVTVEVFVPNGRRVATILDRELGEGRHQVKWDHAKDSVPSGVYFVSVTQGSERTVSKLVIGR